MIKDCKTAILISGSGTNLQAFIDAVENNNLNLNLLIVLSNNPHAYGLERAKRAGIEISCIEHAKFLSRELFDEAIIRELEHHEPDLLILAGFMRILSPIFIRKYFGKILNIHPSLLPKYPGLDTHQRALSAGDKWHGSTVHFVTEELDCGPQILQGRIAINYDESADELKERVQKIEHEIFPLAASWVSTGKAKLKNGECWIDGKVSLKPPLFTF
ncbi:MAG: phosphoribosylglycinamide formyltransferase [Gammaproteobacteria bacterium]|nr:phosphoribosylglycinamide formyltransferase [Gammaproteobacteria bacterium]|tara:strand:- start:295 stop:942 length:648 start_codon:yes stop_codon:yes gene_type:complete